ncbi:hypothetical protein MC885_021703 [Smutsia gigantea]|nr:hypothetical protein MC885_021703 [Smutsia gigantea]
MESGLTPTLLCPTASLLRRLREHIQRFQESSSLGLGLSPGTVAIPKEGWLEQPLDPFNASDRRSFLQRYWANDQHWASQDGPVFLHLGGEGSLGPASVMRGHPAALAPAWGALVIGLEHRFYGLSVPARGLDMAQLRFLSSRHALADVVSARLALARLFNVSFSSTWICFGGSYAGSLAAWARLKVPGTPLGRLGRGNLDSGAPTSDNRNTLPAHSLPHIFLSPRRAFQRVECIEGGNLLKTSIYPHLIFASVASSAPVQAVLDFSEYNEVVSRSLMSVAIGGSPEVGNGAQSKCREAASAAFSEVERRLRAGRTTQAALRADLGACGSLNRAEDQAELLGALQALVVIHSLGQKCLSFSRAETVAQLRVTEPQESGVGDRQWLYQTCTEFGFYVTCEDPRCPFSQLPALPSHLELCEQVFGLSASSIAQAVAQTNSYYGGQTPGATQVLFVNGDTDPWHVLSVTQALGSSKSVLLIPGASHCLDMASESPADSLSLRQGRQIIFQQLQTWLRLAKNIQVRGGI